ncbi:TatD family hydrolase [Oceanispirochaeta sp. M2]|nr:TatD family hydrolase [Oceanispirochaeta sp. M2]NPD73469.1 TatD family hydrolase [Oceanispirochaeta sp. M1]
MSMYSDAHLHSSHSPCPDMKSFSDGGLYISCAAGPDDWQTLLDTKYIVPFLGLHPERINENWERLMPQLEKLIEQNPHAGIGECGLDKRFYKTVPKAVQEKILSRQIEIAEKYRRPVVLHQVGASGALADFLSDLNPGVPMMIHGFKESSEILKRYIKLGMYISLGQGSHWDHEDFLKTARLIPRDKLLLETDWPYCIPASASGTGGDRDHRPSYSDCLSEHYKRVSAKFGIDIPLLSRLVKENGTLFTH